MLQFQISKYNPSLKTEAGKLLKDDWTAVSDIGKIFSGKLLTVEEYLSVENRYILFLKSILNETESTYLKVVGLEKFDDYLKKLDNLTYEYKSDEIYESLTEGKLLNLNDSLILLKLILRENVWCYLTNKFITIKIGYDYYIDLTIEKKPKIFDTLEENYGLFVQSI